MVATTFFVNGQQQAITIDCLVLGRRQRQVGDVVLYQPEF